MNNTEIVTFFDRLAANWNDCPDEYDRREEIVSLAGFTSGGIVADIGCGRGVMFAHLLKTEPEELIAVDISAEMIKHAKGFFPDPRITYLHADLLKAELPMLDAAIIYNAYPHFLHKQAFVEKLVRHIKKDGFLVIAHGICKEEINGVHDGECVSRISVPLEPAEQEAAKFEPFFTPELLIDNADFYMLKLLRK
ncbi:MAG: class I SAM-dependent methyltransferase [Oscillospiraceae bacterium]|jgi:demethylmenaquinone methyltransferase/2-methoxy-6-polyprenyl-1,4-benzoquinol methylase|nr:class I SAM-dependent methyltransferase [Oscillospiraceae bacterium]